MLQRSLDPISSVLRRLVLPHDDEPPSGFGQSPFGVGVPALVCGQLVGPPSGVGLGCGSVERAGVPITPTNVDDHVRPSEDNVVSTPLIDHGYVDAVSIAPPMQFPSQREFGSRIALPLSPHPGQSRGSRSRWNLHKVEKR